MRIGLFVPSFTPFATPEWLTAVGQAADEFGIATLWLGEHVVSVDDYASAYPYAEDGRVPLPPQSQALELFTSLAFLAGVTQRVRLGTAVCLLPQRHPVVTAKESATLDWLSNGRLDLGVGIGWLREEFEALGVPFEDRAARCREYVDILRTMWCDEISRHSGRFYDLPPCRMYPKPLQRPHPPIFFGGESDAALRRVAELGSGWHGFGHTAASARERIERLDKLLVERDRSLDEIDIVVCPNRPLTSTDLADYRDAGVDQLVATTLDPAPDGMHRAIGDVAAELLTRSAR